MPNPTRDTTAGRNGVAFDPTSLSTVPIRGDDEYHGLRMTMVASLSRARLKLQLDVSFGDPVTPEPKLIDYPQTLEGTPFPLYGYPIATVIAEKLSTAVALGDLSSPSWSPSSRTSPTHSSPAPPRNESGNRKRRLRPEAPILSVGALPLRNSVCSHALNHRERSGIAVQQGIPETPPRRQHSHTRR